MANAIVLGLSKNVRELSTYRYSITAYGIEYGSSFDDKLNYHLESELDCLRDIIHDEYRVDYDECKALFKMRFDVHNYSEVQKEIAKNHITSVVDSVLDMAIGASVSFAGLYQPQAYNYQTDKVEIDIELNESVCNAIQSYLNTHISEFKEYLADNFTAHSGFIPHHSNDIEDWVLVSDEQFQWVIDFIVHNELRKEHDDEWISEFTDFSLWDYDCDIRLDSYEIEKDPQRILRAVNQILDACDDSLKEDLSVLIKERVVDYTAIVVE